MLTPVPAAMGRTEKKDVAANAVEIARDAEFRDQKRVVVDGRLRCGVRLRCQR